MTYIHSEARTASERERELVYKQMFTTTLQAAINDQQEQKTTNAAPAPQVQELLLRAGAHLRSLVQVTGPGH